MRTKDVIELGTRLGLIYRVSNNPKEMLSTGRITFDGYSGQYFIIDTTMDSDNIYCAIGDALMCMGKRMKTLEIARALSTNED